ncbi:dicarboxylate/amino acid:cation symporter [Enterococcus sp. AZ109]|uniref:dicarboxylate/amino acid:cation symporter n=1 Tax=Enterococcus sp. AZ109 TaxID=2774634 RepID=UPI003F686396
MSMRSLRKISLTNQIMIAMVVGIIVGAIFQQNIVGVKVIGDIFLRLIQMSVVVLIMGSVIEAVGGLEIQELRKIGFRMFVWFMGSTVIAAVIGVVFGLVVKPGVGLEGTVGTVENLAVNDGSLQEIILDFIPQNIIAAMAEANMIQVIIFALFFGLALSLTKQDGKGNQLLDWVSNFNNVILKMVTLIMQLAPIGIFALIASVVGEIGVGVLGTLMKFLLTLGTAAVLYLIVWLGVAALYCKVNFTRLVKNIWRITMIAVTTTSSAVSLPVKLEDGREKLGIGDRINKLVMPLGMSLNSNGLAMYLSLSIVTFAQFFQIELTIGQLTQAVLLSTLACLGTVVVPGGGLVALATVMPMLGLPTASIALLAGIDWFSGVFRTLLNVDIDVLVALIIAKDENELDRDIFNGKKVYTK